MYLYISSYHLGENADQFAMHIKNKKVGIIPNALDFSEDMDRVEKSLQRETADMKEIGLDPEIVDLKEYFGKNDLLVKKMESFNGVWVIGGNTFVLRRAFAYSGFDQLIIESVRKNIRSDFVYGGFSAGICVLPESLKGSELTDEPTIVPPGYKSEIIWEGLGILPYFFVPHYRSDHPESEMSEKTVEYCIQQKLLFKALKDGEDLIEKI